MQNYRQRYGAGMGCRLPETKANQTVLRRSYASRGTNVFKGGVLSKESVSYVEKMVGPENDTDEDKGAEEN